jgi:hypothetical protein
MVADFRTVPAAFVVSSAHICYKRDHEKVPLRDSCHFRIDDKFGPIPGNRRLH